jgi:four helix bundle protein
MSNERKFDLEERTSKFAEDVIKLSRMLKNLDIVGKNIISQLSRSGMSVGSNYCEADCAESKKDFMHKLAIARKEANESKYWLRLLAVAYPESKEECRTLWKESNELSLIFRKIILNTKANDLQN